MLNICLVTAPTITEYEDPVDALSRPILDAGLRPGLGVLTLAGGLRREGYAPRIVDLDRAYLSFLGEKNNAGIDGFVPWAADRILATGAQVFGFSSICSSYPLSLRIAERIKQVAPDCAILFGGPQASIVDLPTFHSFPCVDFILRGEADLTLPVFLREWDGARQFATVPGLTYRTASGVERNGGAALIENLDDLAPPAYDLTGELEGKETASLELGRGCPFSCTFCSTNDFFRRRFRLMSPTRMLADMRRIHEAYGIRHFDLQHDMFTVDQHRVEEFCHAMIESGDDFSWACSARTDCVDENLLALMARAGCTGVFFGVETGSKRMQRIIDKDLDTVKSRAMVEAAGRLGIETTVSLIIGFPEETEPDLRESLDVYMHASRFPDARPQMNILAPLAGTPLYEQFKDQLVLEELCSDVSHQSRSLNRTTRELVRQHPEVFPDFYLLPTPHLDRLFLLELREFLTMITERMRWLSVALHENGAHILDVFLAWRKRREILHPEVNGERLRVYYLSDTFCAEFLRFVREQPESGKPVVAAICSYQEATREAEKARENWVPEGQLVAGRTRLTDRPARERHVHVFQLDWDVQAAIESLKLGQAPGEIRHPKLYRTSMNEEGHSRLVEVPATVYRALELCDGTRSLRQAVAEVAGRFEGAQELREYAATLLLKRLRSEGLIEMYRPAAASVRVKAA